MRKVITMCLYKRPQYTRQVLEHLSRCEGISGYSLLPHVEPGCDETRALVEAVDFAECRPTFNREVLGVAGNTLEAFDDAFALTDFVVHDEEDVVLAPDALRYFEWAADAYRADPKILSVAAYNRLPAIPPEDQWRTVARRAWFHCWGVGLWRDRFLALRPKLARAARKRQLWATTVNEKHRKVENLREVYPTLSRSNNIGLESTLHPELTAEWLAEHHRLDHWGGDVAVPPGPFREV